VAVTGHSLGAALAQHAALDLATAGLQGPPGTATL